MAVYNAGPVKILMARGRIRHMGVDANRWFRNVEVDTLKTVGQETARYVSNISKYCVSSIQAPPDGLNKRRTPLKRLRKSEL